VSWVKRNGGQVSQCLLMLEKEGMVTGEIRPCRDRGESPSLHLCRREGFGIALTTMKNDSAHALSLSQARTCHLLPISCLTEHIVAKGPTALARRQMSE
jgi:hypothetical protein